MKLIKEFAEKWRTKKDNNDNRKMTVVIHGKSVERVDRLKNKITRASNQDLITMALKSLEQKTDRIIRRQAKQRARAMEDEGLSLQQIAERLNNKEIPAVTKTAKWSIDDISILLKKPGG